MSDLTMHLQRIPEWWTEFVNRCQGRLEYVVGVDVFPQYGAVNVLGRTYLLDAESNALVDQGAAGADQWIDRFAPVYAANPHVSRWIGPNEYLLSDQARVDRFNAFHVRFIERMSGLGHAVMCGQVNTGWPRLRKYGDPPPYPEMLAPMLGALYAHGGWFSTHEYWPGNEDPTGNILRYRDTRAALIQAGITNLPDFYVSELGVDVQTEDPDSDYGHWGWREFMEWPVYFALLQGYSRELDKDPYVRGASIFTEGGGWESFELGRDNALALADWIAQDEPEPPVERARGIDVSQWQGEINWQAVAGDGIEFVFIRASVGDDVDPYWEANYQGAGDAGLLRGAYHYLQPTTVGQARTFGRAVEGKDLELGYWADIEADELTAAKCATFFQYADPRVGEPINIYTRASFFDRYGTPSWALGRLLWVADWRDVDEPALPRAWDVWEFWQTTSDGAVPGIVGRVDLDVYNGTVGELHEEYGEPENGGEPVEGVEIRDIAGNLKDEAWLQETYGNVAIAKPTEAQLEGAKGVFRVVKIQEVTDTLELKFHVQGVDQDDVVACYWPDAPELLPYDPPTARWAEQADLLDIILGTAVMNMGGQSDYDPAHEEGAYRAWVLKPRCGSEYITGLGWKMATHYDHLDVFFEYEEIEEPQPPLPAGAIRVTGTVTLDLVIEPVGEE